MKFLSGAFGCCPSRMVACLVCLTGFGVVVSDVAAAGQTADPQANPSDLHSPGASLDRMRVRDGFEVRLVASEPDVIDPVSVAWSADGKLWVVEMSDYPHPPPGQTDRLGRIRVLSDRNSTGRFSTAVTFAEGLDFATGVLPWRDGAIVTLAGKIVFLRDTNGDGQADQTEIWFEGFTIDNEQLRANHPTLGPDGMVYVAGGLRGGEIMAVDDRFDRHDEPSKLHGRDFAFDPTGGSWGTVSGNSQHGLSVDDFNRRLGCSNRNPAIEAVLAMTVVDRDPFLTPGDAITDVGKSGFESEVHPISAAWTTSNLHAGQFSAACGVCAPGQFPDNASEWLWVCEPTGSLVQRQRIEMKDAIWQSSREDESTEWLASTDEWFRPVDLIPDAGGGILVVDMARAVIEHPHWAPQELKNRPDTFYGNDLGRIWQVRRRGSDLRALSITDDASAIDAIASNDPLSRILSSAYWYNRYEKESPPSTDTIQSLTRIVASSDALAASRARVAAVLNRWGLLGDAVLTLRQDDDVRLRALAFSMRHQNQWDGRPLATLGELLTAMEDDERLVRRAALETSISLLDELAAVDPKDSASSPPSRLPDDLLGRMLASRRDGGNPWMRKLWVAVPNSFARDWLTMALPSQKADPKTDIDAAVLQGWMHRVATKDSIGSQTATQILMTWIDQLDESDGAPSSGKPQPLDEAGLLTRSLVIQIASAWQAGVGSRGSHQRRGETSKGFETIDRIALSVAIDDRQAVDVRLNALAWMGQQPNLPPQIRGLIQRENDSAIRAAAYRLLMRRDTEWAKQTVLETAGSMAPTDRMAVVEVIRRDVATATWLLHQIGQQALPRNFVDPLSMDAFRNHSDAGLAKLGRETFAPAGDVAEAMARYAGSASNWETADVVRGKLLFTQHCANCHRIDGVGHVVGPDISDSRDKTPASLLAAILDPSSAIDASFVTYQALTLDGEIITGLLADESGDAVTLTIPGGQTRRVARRHRRVSNFKQLADARRTASRHRRRTDARFDRVLETLAIRIDGGNDQLNELSRVENCQPPTRMERLIDAARAGDGDAMGELLINYRRYLVFLARSGLHHHMQGKADPSDIAQEVCLAAHSSMVDFRGETAEEFAAWLRGILTNTLAMHIRKFLGTGKRDARWNNNSARALPVRRASCNHKLRGM